MNTTGLKLVFDTNIVIAMIGKKSPFRWIFDKIIAGDFIMCISNEIFFEYQEIMTRKNGEIVGENFSNFYLLTLSLKNTPLRGVFNFSHMTKMIINLWIVPLFRTLFALSQMILICKF